MTPFARLGHPSASSAVHHPGAIDHVLNRENCRDPIFEADTDRNRFLVTLTEAGIKADWQAHAYWLMLNHLHLVVETLQANLVAGVKRLLGTDISHSIGATISLATRSAVDTRHSWWTEAGRVVAYSWDYDRPGQVVDWTAQRLPLGCQHTLANCLKKTRAYQ